MPVFSLLAVRFAVSTLLILPFSGIPNKYAWRKGSGIGVLLFGVYALQTWGLVYTSSAHSAFITGLYLVWVAVWSERAWQSWLSVAIALIGLWVLVKPGQLAINIGDVLTVGCSIFAAWHLIMLAKLPQEASSSQIAAVQMIVVTVFAALLALSLGENNWQWNWQLVFAILLLSVGATFFAFWVQTHFQRRTTAMRAGLILAMETVFALIFAILFYGEQATSNVFIGCALILTAMIFAIIYVPGPSHLQSPP